MKTRRLFLVSFLIVCISFLTGWRSHHHKKKIPKEIETPIEEQTTEPKTLDLSLPLKIEEKPQPSQFTTAKPNLPVEKPKRIQREVELEPQSIMSAEPEQDKIKSFDGAGLSINIKR